MRWNYQNGWDALFKQAGTVPGLYPYWLTVNISLAASADFATSVTGTGTAIVNGDAEFYALGGICAGWADGGNNVDEGLGAVAHESPDMYPATVLIREGSGGRTLSAGPCFIGHLFGGGPRPYVWPCPWRILPGTELQFTVEHRFTTQQSMWLTLFGFKRMLDSPPLPCDFLIDPRVVRILAKYRASGRAVSAQPFFYPMAYSGTVGRAPNATEQKTVTMTEADFALVHLGGMVSDPADGSSWMMEVDLDDNIHQDNAAAGLLNQNVIGRGLAQETVRLLVGIGRTRLDDRPVALGALFGTGRKIGRYASPLVIPRGQSLTALVNFKDSTNGVNLPLRADLTFGGVRLVES